ncbi:2Fe-2S iron-sulfur cluster binding domain-containing protein [Fulvivirga sp. M361]|uniref:2Fe-2S iron-sulfur cluster-binding protein n=1 Tax=Fulvivirga sp. M361 TaxID=2594266 RepID=UPI001179D6ED|nr:2Fe-2S iron-sulfur cluster-binding protein [Fulvivirga sp. M361]TRX48488.1 2Fe-2S iron-sulfur cluster binding domain-containing protein [Fulvivirga sp. M361]
MKFYPLEISDLEKTTDECTIVTMKVNEDLQDTFKYTQGQYLTFKALVEGEELRRSYSLCSSPLDKEWKIGVKKIQDGRFSSFVNDHLKVGDTLEVAPPAGRFFVEINATKPRHIVAFAAGSGITPMLSIIKTHLTQEPDTSIQLFYLNRTVSSIILREELEALKNLHMERFELFHILDEEQRNVHLLNGRLDEEKLKQLFNNGLCDKEEIDEVFICGPQPLIFAIKDFLTSEGINEKKIHFELFGTPVTAKSKKADNKFKGKMADVTIHEGGKTLTFKVPQGEGNILDSALNNSADLPFACKGGVCCTCKAKLVEGSVDMLVNYALEGEEVKDGFILTCQSIPTSDKVVVNFDV